jgi:hypothetical protein
VISADLPRFTIDHTRTEVEIRPDPEWPVLPRRGREPALRAARMVIAYNDTRSGVHVHLYGVNIRADGSAGAQNSRGYTLRSSWTREGIDAAPDWLVAIVDLVVPLGALTVACPVCHRGPREPCRDSGGTFWDAHHPQRAGLAVELAAERIEP